MIFVDITEIKRAEAELAKAKAKAEIEHAYQRFDDGFEAGRAQPAPPSDRRGGRGVDGLRAAANIGPDQFHQCQTVS